MYTHKGKYLAALTKSAGGKSKSRDRLYGLFPKYSKYVEPFLGSGTILIGSPKCEEYVNDDCFEIANFYRIVRDLDENELIGFLGIIQNIVHEFQKWAEFGRDGTFFYDFRDSKDLYVSNYELAYWFYIINKSCFNGMFRYNKQGKNNSSYCKTPFNRGWMDYSWLLEVHNRLQNTAIHNLDFEEFFNKCPIDQDTFIIADPPYPEKCSEVPDGNLTRYNGKKFTLDDHRRLVDYLSKTPAKWMVTLSDNQWVRDLYKDFNIIGHEIHYSISQTPKGRGKRPEVIITNYVQ